MKRLKGRGRRAIGAVGVWVWSAAAALAEFAAGCCLRRAMIWMFVRDVAAERLDRAADRRDGR